jgi:hypothetical protein
VQIPPQNSGDIFFDGAFYRVSGALKPERNLLERGLNGAEPLKFRPIDVYGLAATLRQCFAL